MKLILNSLAAWAAVAATMLVGIVVTPTLLVELGTEANGLWRLVVQVVGYYGLVDLALGAAIIRYMAKYLGENRPDDFRDTFQSALAIAAAFSFGLVLLIGVGGGAIANLLFDGTDAETFAILVRLLAVATAVNALNAVFGSVLVAHEQIALNSGVRFVSEMLRMVISVVILQSGGGLIGLGWLFVGLAIAHLALNVVLTRKLHRSLVTPVFGYSRRMAGKLGRFGGTAAAAKIGDILRFQIDLVVLTSIVSLNAAGVYGVVLILIRGFLNAVLAVADTTQPRLARIAGDSSNFRKSLLLYTNVVCLLIAFLAACGFWLIEPTLSVWLPGDFANFRDATVAFRILIVGMAFDMMMVVPTIGLRAINKHKYYAWQNIGEGVANLVLSIVLGSRYGLVGVALGTTIPSLTTKLFIQPVYCARLFGIAWVKLWFAAMRPLFVMLAVMIGTFFVRPDATDSLIGLIALAVPVAFIIGTLTFLAGRSGETWYLVSGLWYKPRHGAVA